MAIKRSQIQAFSAAILAVAASVSAIYIEPYLANATQAEKALGVGASGLLFYFAFDVSQRFFRFLHYRRILGEWYYVTVANDDVKIRDENYASMVFAFDEYGVLTYEVQLYDTVDDLLNKRAPNGKATSEALEYSAPDGEIHILYSVNLYKDNMPRRGRLLINVDASEKLLYGEWGSVITTGSIANVSRGEMLAARPKVFKKEAQDWLKAKGKAL